MLTEDYPRLRLYGIGFYRCLRTVQRDAQLRAPVRLDIGSISCDVSDEQTQSACANGDAPVTERHRDRRSPCDSGYGMLPRYLPDILRVGKAPDLNAVFKYR